jgi:hypothetical protein
MSVLNGTLRSGNCSVETTNRWRERQHFRIVQSGYAPGPSFSGRFANGHSLVSSGLSFLNN